MDFAIAGTRAGKPLGHSAALALGIALLFGLFAWASLLFNDPSAKPFRAIAILSSLVIGGWSLLLAARSRAGGERSNLAQWVLIMPCLAMLAFGFCWYFVVALWFQLPITLFLLMVLMAEVEDSPRFVMVCVILYFSAALPFGISAMAHFLVPFLR